MQNLRRFTAAVLLVAAAMLPALAAAPAYAVGPSSTAVPAPAAGWTYYATYVNLAACKAAGSGSGAAWQCFPSSLLPGGYDLYLFL
jgi:hypothetical protein